MNEQLPGRTVNFWTGTATGHRDDPDDPEVSTVAWSVREGVEILDAQVIEGTMLVIRVRIPDGME